MKLTRRKPPKYRATSRAPLAIFFAALKQIKQSGANGVTRSQLCKEVGISTSTVKKLVAEGVACGYLIEFQPQSRTSGEGMRGKIPARISLNFAEHKAEEQKAPRPAASKSKREKHWTDGLPVGISIGIY